MPWKAAVRRHQRRHSVGDANDNLDEMQETRSDNDKGARLPPRKYRRVSSRRNISPVLRIDYLEVEMPQ